MGTLKHWHIASWPKQWLDMVDASLANRPLDAALPRLLSREPQRLVDRLGFLLTGPGGVNALPAMARLVHAAGEPVIGTLDANSESRVTSAWQRLSNCFRQCSHSDSRQPCLAFCRDETGACRIWR